MAKAVTETTLPVDCKQGFLASLNPHKDVREQLARFRIPSALLTVLESHTEGFKCTDKQLERFVERLPGDARLPNQLFDGLVLSTLPLSYLRTGDFWEMLTKRIALFVIGLLVAWGIYYAEEGFGLVAFVICFTGFLLFIAEPVRDHRQSQRDMRLAAIWEALEKRLEAVYPQIDQPGGGFNPAALPQKTPETVSAADGSQAATAPAGAVTA